MRLQVLDIWHGEAKKKIVYSDNPAFNDVSDFIKWVLQHQKDLSGVTYDT